MQINYRVRQINYRVKWTDLRVEAGYEYDDNPVKHARIQDSDNPDVQRDESGKYPVGAEVLIDGDWEAVIESNGSDVSIQLLTLPPQNRTNPYPNPGNTYGSTSQNGSLCFLIEMYHYLCQKDAIPIGFACVFLPIELFVSDVDESQVGQPTIDNYNLQPEQRASFVNRFIRSFSQVESKETNPSHHLRKYGVRISRVSNESRCNRPLCATNVHTAPLHLMENPGCFLFSPPFTPNAPTLPPPPVQAPPVH